MLGIDFVSVVMLAKFEEISVENYGVYKLEEKCNLVILGVEHVVMYLDKTLATYC